MQVDTQPLTLSVAQQQHSADHAPPTSSAATWTSLNMRAHSSSYMFIITDLLLANSLFSKWMEKMKA